jgi:gliding motility-associated-like protein
LPTVDMPTDTTICSEQTLFLDVSTPQSTSYVWSNGDSTSYSFLKPGSTYTVIAANACGSKSASIIIDTYECIWNIYAPNAFTPNGDGVNDSWEVEAFNVIDFSMSIYNRMGNLVYSTHKLHEPWTPDAEKVGDDVYNYMITAVDRQGKPVSLTGHIVLVK